MPGKKGDFFTLIVPGKGYAIGRIEFEIDVVIFAGHTRGDILYGMAIPEGNEKDIKFTVFRFAVKTASISPVGETWWEKE